MSETIIKIEHLGKRYRLGQRKAAYATFRDSLTSLFKGVMTRENEDTEENHIWALDDVSFEVKKGQVVGIIGRNGAGKSTLLKILSRITEPTRGKITMRGRVGSLLEVGTGFHPELTGAENTYLNGAILGMTRREIKRKFDEIVAFSELEKFIDTPVKFYSSGMYVRLAFAVAAHLEPDIFLVDEVLAVGDAVFQKKCLSKMGDVAKEGRTVMFISHNMAALERLCPKAIWLEKGGVRDIGESTTICEKYLYSDVSFSSGVYKFDDEGYPLQISQVELVNSKGTTTSIFRADETVKVRMTYRVLKELIGVSVSLNISSALGESLWGSADFDFFPELYEKREPGIWIYECTVPANVLKPGAYMMDMGAGTVNKLYHCPDPFPFEISAAGFWKHSHQHFGIVGGPIVVPMQAQKPIRVGDIEK